jgi:hypothetical protein
MSGIREAVVRAPAKLSANEARQLGTTIEQNVSYMIEHCELPPDADAVLHGIIARLMQSASALRGEQPGSDTLDQLQVALRDYAAAFDHPGWQ